MDSCVKFDHLAPSNPIREATLRATERRNPTVVSIPGRTPRISRNDQFESWDAGHPVRQEFRRLLDPGILQNNDKKDAAKSLRAWDPIDDSSP